MYRVRDAVLSDIYNMVEICEKILTEAPTYTIMSFDREKSAHYVYNAIAKVPGWFLRVIVDENDKVVGGMLCICETSAFGPDKLAYDITIMIQEEYRGRCLPQIIQIVDEYKIWALKEGAKAIKIGVSSGLNIDKADKFFAMMGFDKIGAMYGYINRKGAVT